MERRRVGILLFPDVEVLDFCGPFEVFSVTRLDEARRRETPSPYEVVLVSTERGIVRATGGMRVETDHGLDDCPALDLLVVPGGWGTRTERSNARLITWIRERAAQTPEVASVCTGALLLAEAGLLAGRCATTHFRAIDEMQGLYPGVSVLNDARVVRDGRLTTSAGIAAGIDMAIGLVARHHGEPVARATALYMEYPFPVVARSG